MRADGYFGESEHLGNFHNQFASGNPVDGQFNWPTTEGHRLMPLNTTNRKVNGHFVSGGSWLSSRSTTVRRGNRVSVHRNGNLTQKAYEGQYVNIADATKYQTQSLEALNADFMSLFEKGAEALNLLSPTKPDFSLAVSLAELREVPDLLKHLTFDMKNKIRRAIKVKVKQQPHRKKYWYSIAGEHYLAVQFGWIPLFSDIINFAKAFENKHKRLDQLIKDEGKPVRRRRQLNHYTVDNVDYDGSHSDLGIGNTTMRPQHVYQCYAPGRGATYSSKTSSKTWCVGQSRYLLPSGPRTQGWKNQMYRRILGGRITPSVVYNLIPWSWLADYFTDLGQFVEAVSSGVEDRLVWDYAYVMRTKQNIKIDNAWQTLKSAGGTTVKATADTRVHTLIKMRVHASVFGFGFSESALTPNQTAILGALGLSRL